MSSSGAKPLRELLRITLPSPGSFRDDFVRARRPVVIEGLARDWAARRWSTEFLRQRAGDRVVPCFATRQRAIVVDPRHGLAMERRPLADAIERIERGALGCRVRADIAADLPDLAADLEPPAWVREGLGAEAYLWVTPAGDRTALHWDSPENLFVHLHGEKSFALAAPEYGAWLDPHPLCSATPQFARVDYGRDDPRRPNLRAVPFASCTLRSGDALFIPSGWWHHAESLDVTVSVSFWWLRLARLHWTLPYALAKRLFTAR